MAEATVQTGAAHRRRSRGLSEKRLAFWMVSPSMVLIAIVAAYPILYAIWMSLHEYSVRQAGLSRWAGPFGLRNYSTALGNSEFWSAMVTTLVFTVSSVFLELVIGLAMALAMHAAFRGQGLLRTVVLVPWALLTVVTGIMWRTIFESPQGFVNNLIGGDTVWLGSEPQALIVIIIADVWKTAPFMALLILAGLQVIPGDIYEAAKVDGATAWQRFWRITVPLMKPAILVALLFRTLDAFRVFDTVFIQTRGAQDTETVSILGYNVLINRVNLGLGSAISVLIFIAVIMIAVLFVKGFGASTAQQRGEG
jgi:multiple sugar transport system permease protein